MLRRRYLSALFAAALLGACGQSTSVSNITALDAGVDGRTVPRVPDGGHVVVDAGHVIDGHVVVDSGHVIIDAARPIDAGQVVVDGGGTVIDAGHTAIDAGQPPAIDAGSSGGTGDGGSTGLVSGPIPAACTPSDMWPWEPSQGYKGGLIGHGQCGHNTGNCPTTYVPGNIGAACTTNADCTGQSAICQGGTKYGGGTCVATGCELGSNYGCPAGDTCIDAGNGDTYCLEGCGIDISGCFRHCSRTDFACFNTESKSLGYCLDGNGISQCDPTAATLCDYPLTTGTNDGTCQGTSWDDPHIGKCFQNCDPVLQNCAQSGLGCYLQRALPYPVCYQSWGMPEGSSCTRLTQCAPGLACECDYADTSLCPNNTNMHCRYYCEVDGSYGRPCQAGTTCQPIGGLKVGTCKP